MAAARQGTPQRGSGGWPPDIKPCLCVTMKSVLNAKPPLTASAYSASLRLCVKHLYTFYMFYTAKGASGARLGARPNRRLRHPASRNAPGCFAKVSQTVGSWRRFGFRTSNNKLRLACHASASITGCVQYASYACEPRPLLL